MISHTLLLLQEQIKDKITGEVADKAREAAAGAAKEAAKEAANTAVDRSQHVLQEGAQQAASWAADTESHINFVVNFAQNTENWPFALAMLVVGIFALCWGQKYLRWVVMLAGAITGFLVGHQGITQLAAYSEKVEFVRDMTYDDAGKGGSAKDDLLVCDIWFLHDGKKALPEKDVTIRVGKAVLYGARIDNEGNSLIGASKGDMREVMFSFPDGYEDTEVAGKKGKVLLEVKQALRLSESGLGSALSWMIEAKLIIGLVMGAFLAVMAWPYVKFGLFILGAAAGAMLANNIIGSNPSFDASYSMMGTLVGGLGLGLLSLIGSRYLLVLITSLAGASMITVAVLHFISLAAIPVDSERILNADYLLNTWQIVVLVFSGLLAVVGVYVQLFKVRVTSAYGT